jgi:hypothetical protein
LNAFVDPVSSKQWAVIEGNGTLKQHHLTLRALSDDTGFSIDFMFVIDGSNIPP